MTVNHFISRTFHSIFTGLLATAVQAQDAKLPDTMLWSTYDVGSSGYVEASAIADAFGKSFSTKVRILPSGTSVSRLMPMKQGKVKYGWLADELYFATEATYDFASLDWGPQDLRVIAGRPSTFGFAAAKDAGIQSIADLRGKRIPRIIANPSINIKVEAMLAFGGLTWDDVQVVEVPSYGAALNAVVDGLADAAGTTPTAATTYELESSSRGLMWLPLPANNEDGWKAIKSVADFFEPVQATEGAGLSKDNPASIFAVRYPMITVYADMDEDEVYNFTKALDKTYGLYKDSTAAMPAWDLKLAGTTPSDAPFHKGAIRYLKEIGVWTDKDEAWNTERLARLEKIKSAWTQAQQQAKAENISAENWPVYWEKFRSNRLK